MKNLLWLGLLLFGSIPAFAQNPLVDRMCCVKFSKSTKYPEVCNEILAHRERCEPILREYLKIEQQEAAKARWQEILIDGLIGICVFVLVFYAYVLYRRQAQTKKGKPKSKRPPPPTGGNAPKQSKPRPPPPRRNLGSYE